MINVHANPEAHGVRFGRVVVTVDVSSGDCVVRAPQPGKIMEVERSFRLHSLDEIRSAYAFQQRLGQTSEVARDIAEALKFAGLKIKNEGGALSE